MKIKNLNVYFKNYSKFIYFTNTNYLLSTKLSVSHTKKVFGKYRKYKIFIKLVKSKEKIRKGKSLLKKSK